MTEFNVDTDNISTQACELISSFPNGNFILAGLDDLQGTPCLISIPDTMLIPTDLMALNYNPSTLNIFDAATQQIVGKESSIPEPGQICVNPNITFDPDTEAVYNPSTHKIAAIEKVVCDKRHACTLPEGQQHKEKPCKQTDDAFNIGVAIGATLATLGAIGYFYADFIRKKCCSHD